MGRIRESTLVPTAQNRANATASRRASVMADYGDEVWALDPMDLMSVEEFELHLVRKFGSEYLEPIPYAWQGGGVPTMHGGYISTALGAGGNVFSAWAIRVDHSRLMASTTTAVEVVAQPPSTS